MKQWLNQSAELRRLVA